MRVLFDQATPVPSRSYLEGHTVTTAFRQGWDTLKNGELLAAAEQAGFETRDVESLREHYPQTLRHWVHRLDARRTVPTITSSEVRVSSATVTGRVVVARAGDASARRAARHGAASERRRDIRRA
jgi:hypothetical protein